MNQARRTSELFKLIRSLGYESALVGGLAVSMRSRERFTKDIDFAVAVNSDADAENLTFAMQQHRFELMQVVEQKSKGIMSTVRFRHPEDKIDEPSVDLLVGSSGIEREIVAEAESLELVVSTHAS